MTKTKVIVIGAGLGGLSAAISLAQENHEVELFEKNDKVGGKLNIMTGNGFSFDLGPSILTLPHIFDRTFAKSGKKLADYVKIEPVLPHWRNFFEDGTVFDFHPDKQHMDRELAKVAPEESEHFYSFLEYSKKLYEAVDSGYFAKGLDTLGDIIREHGPIKSFFDFDVLRTMDRAVGSFVKNPYLREALDYFVKYVGSSPYDAPAMLNLMPHVQFGYGLWYVTGGMYNLARGIERLAKEVGVKIHLNSEVVKIEKEEEEVTGIVLKDGTKVKADFIVSNMEVIPAYEKLLEEDKRFLKKYEKFEPACSGLVLHLGVKKLYPQLAHHNFLYSKDPRTHFELIFKKKELPVDPTIYLVAPCKSDKSIAPEGCEIIKVLPHIPHIRDTNPHTKEDYLKLREVVLDKLERMGLKDLRKNIVYELMWTPLDIREKYYSNKGAIYGVVSDKKKNLGFKAPKKSRKYSNLYFVGGSVNPGGGMPMAFLSGQNTAERINKAAIM